MLSEKSRPYIEASVPVLREHGETITRAFYRNLFAAYPELTNLFNMGNQARGAQQQSLASAVFAYAANYDNPEVLAPVIRRIAHKHVALGIVPEQYPIVGHHLLGAIKETLGDAATPELLEAWGEAYGLLADVLIGAEKSLYEEQGICPGTLRPMRVSEVTSQSELITSYTLEPVDGHPVAPFKPGQYVSLAVDFSDGSRQLRQYSLSDAPKKRGYRISVKREPAGEGTPAGRVSNWLHDNLQVSSVIAVGPPCGEFTFTEGNEPIVLLSAGVGITPMISALNHLACVNPQRSVVFGHAARDRQSHAHRSDITAAQATMPHLRTVTFYEQLEETDRGDGICKGFMDIATLPDWSYADTEVYLCGPLGFMRTVAQSLIDAGVPPIHIHREVFGPEMFDAMA